eukprot:gene14342-11174_t
MAGTQINPSAVVQVLGVLIDEQLTWEPQATEAARRSRNAVHAMHRAARHLPTRARGDLTAALALPYLDYCQLPMVQLSAAADRTFQKAYNYAARVAARQLRWRPGLPEEQWSTGPALKRLHRWTTWPRRRAAERAATVCAIWHREHPRSLRKWLPDPPTEPLRGRVPQIRPLLRPRSDMGEKMFAYWAPVIATKAVMGTVLHGLPDVKRSPRSTKNTPHMARPSDEWATQRIAYHREVVGLYAGWGRYELPPRSSSAWATIATSASRPGELENGQCLPSAVPPVSAAMPPDTPGRQLPADTLKENVLGACLQSSSFCEIVPVLAESTRAGEASGLLVMGNCYADALSKVGARQAPEAERSIPRIAPTLGA